MARQILLKRGYNSGLSTLSLKTGEPAFVMDTGKLYIGTSTGRTLINPDTISKLETARTIALNGDVTASGSFDGSANLNMTATLPNIVTASTKAKITYNAKGQVTAGANLTAEDIPMLTLSKISNAGTAAVRDTGTISGTVPVLDASGKLPTSTIPICSVTSVCGKSGAVALIASDVGAEPSIATKLTAFNRSFESSPATFRMNGTPLVGSSNNIPRADHVHPKDTSKADLDSPAFTGTPTAPTPNLQSNNTQVATTAFVNNFFTLNGNAESLLPFTYKCTGVNDNHAICTLINDFLNTDSDNKAMRLTLEGTCGVDKNLMQDDDGNMRCFYVKSSNPFNKTIIMDGTSCVFPKISYTHEDNLEAAYFQMEHVQLENISCQMEVVIEGYGTQVLPGARGQAFYGCGALRNCQGQVECRVINTISGAKSNGYVKTEVFKECQDLLGCKAIATAIMTEGGYEKTNTAIAAQAMGFSNCKNLIDCHASCVSTAKENVAAFAYGFKGCENLSLCQSETDSVQLRFSDPGILSGSVVVDSELLEIYPNDDKYDNMEDVFPTNSRCYAVSRAIGFVLCSNLQGCNGRGTATGKEQGQWASGYGFYGCQRLSNCAGQAEAYSDGSVNTMAYGFMSCSLISNCKAEVTKTVGEGNIYGFYECDHVSNSQALAIREGGAGNSYGFFDSMNLTGCHSIAYRNNADGGNSQAYYWSKNLAQSEPCVIMTGCRAPYAEKGGYSQDGSVTLDYLSGSPRRTKYSIMCNSLFMSVSTPTANGSDYHESGNISTQT